jgi:hypothetical protein
VRWVGVKVVTRVAKRAELKVLMKEYPLVV